MEKYAASSNRDDEDSSSTIPGRWQKGARMKSILDPSFRYTPSVQTDIRKTFARIRREQRAHEPRIERDESLRNVLAILPRRQAAPASSR
ncbi:MAG TPA: hypothetical protein VLQ46_00220 [Casimicrobiaceae bacterium]|nr:hypothetical protein [Casimicrobiaceae bacterium]